MSMERWLYGVLVCRLKVGRTADQAKVLVNDLLCTHNLALWLCGPCYVRIFSLLKPYRGWNVY